LETDGPVLASGRVQVTVFDARKEAMENLAAAGAKAAESVAGCTGNDAILIAVANDEQVEDVIAGPQGILDNLKGEMRPIIAVLSTVSPDTIRRMGDQCQSRGVQIIDAPVSGTHVAAESGNLTAMVGGSTDTIEVMRPVLSAVARKIYHVGVLGSGETVKLTNNMIGIINTFLTVEALALGIRNGVPVETLLPIIDASSGNASLSEREMARSCDFSKDLNAAQRNLSLCLKLQRSGTWIPEFQTPVLSNAIKALK
jgi:3-hydroxyisobutyrate dehydrogenase-like beta-hydroxyacid dehydrogenase